MWGKEHDNYVRVLQEERVNIQKKTFTKWANCFLKESHLVINDLFTDLSDGNILMKLLEIVSGEKIGRPDVGRMRLQMLDNCRRCLEFLATKVHFTNIGPEDIVDGNPRLILGLMWTIILRFEIQETAKNVDEESKEEGSAKDALLLWCKFETAGYSGVNITDFSKSWRNGLAFNALIHAHRPDLVEYERLDPVDHIGNLNKAFDVAANEIGIPQILDAEDVDLTKPDEKIIMTYMAACYKHFSKMKSESTDVKGNTKTDLEDQNSIKEPDIDFDDAKDLNMTERCTEIGEMERETDLEDQNFIREPDIDLDDAKDLNMTERCTEIGGMERETDLEDQNSIKEPDIDFDDANDLSMTERCTEIGGIERETVLEDQNSIKEPDIDFGDEKDLKVKERCTAIGGMEMEIDFEDQCSIKELGKDVGEEKDLNVDAEKFKDIGGIEMEKSQVAFEDQCSIKELGKDVGEEKDLNVDADKFKDIGDMETEKSLVAFEDQCSIKELGKDVGEEKDLNVDAEKFKDIGGIEMEKSQVKGIMILSESANMENAQALVSCSLCENETPGEHYCFDCKFTICMQCEKSHRKIVKDHKVVPRSQVGDAGGKVASSIDHGERADIQESKRKSFQNFNEIMKDILPKLENRRKYIESERENYEIKVHKVTKQMEAENRYLHEEIERIQNERVKHLNKIQEAGLMVFDHYTREVTKKKEILLDIEQLYNDAIEKETLQSFPNKPLPEIGSLSELPQPPSFLEGNKLKLVDTMGKLLESLRLTTPKVIAVFQSPLHGSASICINKEDDVWIGGFESREIVMVDIDGQVLKRRNTSNRNRSLAVFENGDIVLSPVHKDSSVVSRLQGDGQVKQLFDVKPTRSTGVFVTTDQKILICTWNGKVVSVNSDGTGVKELYNGSGDGSVSNAIADTEGNIFISDRKTHAVVLVEKDGKGLLRLTHIEGGQRLTCPVGLALDGMGNILCADKVNNSVYIIRGHQIKELLGPSHGISEPRDLAVDNFGRLWITQSNGIIHVANYLV